MRTVILNNQSNAFPESQMNLGFAGESLYGIGEMRLTNFKANQEHFWVIIQFFNKDRYPLEYVSIDQLEDLPLQVKEDYSSYVVILNTNDREREVSFNLDLIAKN